MANQISLSNSCHGAYTPRESRSVPATLCPWENCWFLLTTLNLPILKASAEISSCPLGRMIRPKIDDQKVFTIKTFHVFTFSSSVPSYYANPIALKTELFFNPTLIFCFVLFYLYDWLFSLQLNWLFIWLRQVNQLIDLVTCLPNLCNKQMRP